MTIASEIQRVQTNIANAYTSLEAKGATMPSTRNSASLASTIDSVSSTGDNTVQAFAVGNAENAVEGDKVTLNFSAGILPIEESVTVSSSTDYFFTGYAKNTEAVFLSGSYAYIFRKNSDGIWSKTSTTSFGSQGANKRCSPFGLLIDLYSGTGFKVINGYLASLDYSIAGRTYEPRDRALFSTTGEYCAVFSYTGSEYKTVVYYKNNLLQVLDEWTGTSNTSVPRFFFANKDGVEYLFVGNTGTLVRTQTPHAYKLTPNGAEYLGQFSVTMHNGDYVYTYATASVGDLLITSSSDDNTTLSNIGMFKTEIDLTQQTVVLKDASKEFTSFKNILKFPEGDALNLVPTGDTNIIQYRGGCVKYNPSEGTFEPYLPTGVMSDRVFYNADEKVAVKIIDNTTKFSLYRLLQPVEQPYVATSFADHSYCFSSGLTGIVKENNNGILKVSTVEDPNNPPPAVPDTDGLKTTINYGSAKGALNATTNGNLTITNGTQVSNFTNSKLSLCYTNSPLVEQTILNSFTFNIRFSVEASSYDQMIMGFYNTPTDSDEVNGLFLKLNAEEKLCLGYGTSSSSYLITGTNILTSGVVYDVRISYTKSTKKFTLMFRRAEDSLYTTEGSGTISENFNQTTPYIVFGCNKRSGSSSYNFRGTIYFRDTYLTKSVDYYPLWSGVKPTFGSVGIGYGYFSNTLSNPSDKYVAYDGGVLTEDNIFGEKATEMSVVLGRSAEGDSWTSGTEGFITTQDTAVTGANKKLPTPVYLWHDLSYITPVVPDTLDIKVKTGQGYEVNTNVVGTLNGATENYSPAVHVSGFSSSNYVTHSSKALRTPGSYFYVYIGFTFMVGGTDQYLLGSSSGTGPIHIKVNSSNQLVAEIFTTNSSTPTYTLTGTTTLTPGMSTYRAYLSYGSSGYKLYLSTDGGSNVTEASNSSTTPPYSGVTDELWFGYSFNGSPWLNEITFGNTLITCGVSDYSRWEGSKQAGSISLEPCWKTLDSFVLSGQHTVSPYDTPITYEYSAGYSERSVENLKASNNLNGIDKSDLGNINIDSNNVASGFDGSSELTSGGNATVINQPQDSMNVNFSFSFDGTLVASSGGTTNLCSVGYNEIKVRETDGKYYLRAMARTVNASDRPIPHIIEFGLSGESNDYTTYVPFDYELVPNTRYWVRLSYNKETGYSLSVSTDGISYTGLGTAPELKAPADIVHMSCGYNLTSAMGLSVYLNNWYVDINNKQKAWSALGTTNSLYVVKGSGDLNYGLAMAGGKPVYYQITPEGSTGFSISYIAFVGTVELYPEGGIKSFTPAVP